MDVEILTRGDRKMEAPIAITGFTQVFDVTPVRAYRLTLKAHQKIKIKRNAPMLIISLNNGSEVVVNKKTFTAQGDFLFVKSSRKIQVANKSEQDYSFAVLELK